MKIATNIQRTGIIFGKVFLYRFASIFSSQNHDTCSRSNASGNKYTAKLPNSSPICAKDCGPHTRNAFILIHYETLIRSPFMSQNIQCRWSILDFLYTTILCTCYNDIRHTYCKPTPKPLPIHSPLNSTFLRRAVEPAERINLGDARAGQQCNRCDVRPDRSALASDLGEEERCI